MYIVYVFAIEFGFQQHLTYVIHVVQQNKKKKAPACRVTWKKQTRGEGKQTFLAQVSFSDCLLSVVYVRLAVRPSVCKVLNFRLLLQNHWANFNQTWHKSSLGGGDPKLFK
jgi:hypothetical protein